MKTSTRSRWQDEYLEYDAPHLRIRQVATLVSGIAPRRMADLGCANGYLRKLCPGVEYTGCDFVDLRSGEEFQFVKCDFNDAPLPSQISNLDLVVCSGILEYIEDVPSFIRQIYSRLAPSGIMIATYFNMNHISRTWDLLLGRTFQVHGDWRGFHSPRSMKHIMETSGFAILNTYAVSHSVRPAPPAEATIARPLELPRSKVWSLWLAHQLIFVCKKKNLTMASIGGER